MMHMDIAIIGGSLGGLQAAISACEAGKRVYLCEETRWLGGQLTSQAVPPDEHRWIERQGGTRRYLRYRQAVRAYYRNLPNAAPGMRALNAFCPGDSWVSRVAHEPIVAHRLLMAEAQPYLDRGLLTIRYQTRAVAADVREDLIRSVTVLHGPSGVREEIVAAYFLDATDTGELLPLVGARYRVGAESRADTGEPHAPEAADPEDMQPITHVAALRLDENAPPLPKPERYDFFAAQTMPRFGHHLLSWNAPDGATGRVTRWTMFDGEPGDHDIGLWRYRQIVNPAYYTDRPHPVTLLNWPQNDYALGNVIDCADAAAHLEEAREMTRCCVYWLRHEAPRADGGKGYPIAYEPSVMGTEDGLAMAPYIRESRRIIAKGRVVEQDLAKACVEHLPHVPDSVGVGSYAIDLHCTTRTHATLFAEAWPFELPLSVMVPEKLRNLIPACKNVGTTHLTNGCFRLHPIEWNIGEVAGYLAAYCLDRELTPAQVLESSLTDFQRVIAEQGVQLHWRLNDQLEE
mgnify:CR=1 FL=1